MCGFAGCLSEKKLYSPEVLNDAVHTMNNMIIHRGPDDSGYYQDEDITMGFRRLSILDLTAAGHQPMPYKDGRYMLTFNGEIYNYLELRADLEKEGYTFKSDTDSEVLVAMYDHDGVDCVKKFRGMFAFVIWDTKEKTMFGARDMFGIKPLYYAEVNGQLFYGSEQKSLYPLLREQEFNHKALQDYMTFQFVPEPETLSRQIQSLLPGTYMYKKLGQPLEIKRYVDTTFSPVNKSEDEYAKEVRDVMINSVKIHMRSDVPVGAFLSGGIDSTIVASIAKNFNDHLKTFSVGFQRKGYSELDVAQETAEILGVENYSHIITPEEFMKAFSYFVWSMDDPLADPAAVPQFFLTKTAREQVKVALTGEGADELFGGYTIYHEPLSLRPFKYLKPLNGALHLIGKMMPEGMKGKSYLLRGTVPLEKRYVGNAFIFGEQQKQQFIKNYNTDDYFAKVMAPYYQQAADYDQITKMQYIDIHEWLNGDLLRNADRTSLAHSLELRTPFLDKEVFKVASQIPADLRIKDGTTKYILRKAVEDIIPAHVLHRRKLGFPVPIRFWLKDEMYDWARDIINQSPTDKYFDKQYFLKLLEDHRKGVRDNSRKLWTILTFMTWYQQYIVNAGTSSMEQF